MGGWWRPWRATKTCELRAGSWSRARVPRMVPEYDVLTSALKEVEKEVKRFEALQKRHQKLHKARTDGRGRMDDVTVVDVCSPRNRRCWRSTAVQRARAPFQPGTSPSSRSSALMSQSLSTLFNLSPISHQSLTNLSPISLQSLCNLSAISLQSLSQRLFARCRSW